VPNSFSDLKYICCGDDADINVKTPLEAIILPNLYNKSGLEVNMKKFRISRIDSEYFRMRFDTSKKEIRAYAPRLIASFLYRTPANNTVMDPNELRSTLNKMIVRGYDKRKVNRVAMIAASRLNMSKNWLYDVLPEYKKRKLFKQINVPMYDNMPMN
jgi:hypothetical protein